MATIDSVRLALEEMANSLGLDMHEQAQRREAQQPAKEDAAPRPDSVEITPSTLRKLQARLNQEEPLTPEQAQKALEQVRNAEARELEQAHGGLDPARVFALLGLDE